MITLPEPVRDTACFSDRQWFVGSCAVTTEKDAEEAIKLAGLHATDKCREVAAKATKAVDDAMYIY